MRKTKTEALKTREDLILTALDTFDKKGVAHASLNEIAQTAGVTRGALYWHFKNKEDLFEALFQHIFEDFEICLAADADIDASNDWISLSDALVNMFERIKHNETHRKFINILHLKCEHTEQNESIIRLMDKYREMWHALLTEKLRACVAQKQLPPDLNLDLAVLYLHSVTVGLTIEWLQDIEKFDIAKIAPALIKTTLSSLQTSILLRTKQGK